MWISPDVVNNLINNCDKDFVYHKSRISLIILSWKYYHLKDCQKKAGIVQSSFWIHVSHTNGGLNPPLRLSDRQGSNVSQTREGSSFRHTDETPNALSVRQVEPMSLRRGRGVHSVISCLVGVRSLSEWRSEWRIEPLPRLADMNPKNGLYPLSKKRGNSNICA